MEFVNEGAFWFPDLTAPDPTLVMPLMMSVLFLLNTEIRANHHPEHIRMSWRQRVSHKSQL